LIKITGRVKIQVVNRILVFAGLTRTKYYYNMSKEVLKQGLTG